MPFDISIPEPASVNTADMTITERLEFLRDFLRTPTANLYWDYDNGHVDPECGTCGCAYGWYDYLSQTFSGHIWELDEVLPNDVFDRLFEHAHIARGIHFKEVTPTMVADDIEAYLKGELDV
tara:strand:- start:924 stop:1289 length:366 start_codon:yes stop_codon:yes gene_type:complete